MNNGAEKNRIVYFDLLRIAAAFSVVMLHSAAQFWYTLDIYSRDWLVANSYDALFRFGVPIFVMISGAIFLDRDYCVNTKRLYMHNILRMGILYGFWSCIYGLWDSRHYDLSAVGIKPLLKEMLGGRYHLWFLPMIMGIYMLVPILKEWLEHAKIQTIRYFLILFFIFQILAETVRALAIRDEVQYILDLADVELVCSYVGYFIWGYYLSHVGIGRRLCKVFYVAVLPAAVCNILLGNLLAYRAGMPVGTIYDSFGLFTFIIVTAIYLFAVNRGSRSTLGLRSQSFIRELSASTLGVYFMHIGLIEGLEVIGIHSMLISNIIGIPLYAVVCFGICAVMAALLRRIPYVGKYIC